MTQRPKTPPPENYLNEEKTLASWFFTHDHKRIALLYLASITFFFLLGSFAALLMRAELVNPHGEFFTSTTYNKLFTLHGVIMVWFFLIPSIPNVLGNFLIPLMIGARDMAFPRLNLISWYVFNLGGIFAVFAILVGGVDTGWTFYTPYSSTYSNGWVIAMAVGIFINGFSSIFTGLNFIVTVHKLRAPGMTWFRMPLFVWSMYSTSLIFVLATPVLAITLLLIALERGFGVGVFDPRLGGDPLLFQHLFWFYSHPAVYIMVLPAMGVVSELIACFSRKRIFGYNFVVYASLGIAFLGFLVWGHHMFVSGQSVYAGMIFSLLSFFVAIPSAIKVFNWTATLYKGQISFDTPMLYAFGFIGLFTIGGMTGLDARLAGRRCSCHADLFRRRAFPLHHGRGRGHGLPRRHPLLVPENDRPSLPGTARALVRTHHFSWFQSHLLSPVHPRLHGHAPPLPRLSRGVPAPEYRLHFRPAVAWSRLLFPAGLPRLGGLLRASGA